MSICIFLVVFFILTLCILVLVARLAVVKVCSRNYQQSKALLPLQSGSCGMLLLQSTNIPYLSTQCPHSSANGAEYQFCQWLAVPVSGRQPFGLHDTQRASELRGHRFFFLHFAGLHA